MQKLLLLFFFSLCLFSCNPKTTVKKVVEENPISTISETTATITSPNGKIGLSFELDEEGKPYYTVQVEGEPILNRSYLGFKFEKATELITGFSIEAANKSQFDETWETVWGEEKYIRNHYHEYKVQLSQTKNQQKRLLNIVFRVFDDGIGFRYEFPEQEHLKNATITDELTEFNLTGDHTCWWTPADYDSYEHLYKKTKLSAVNSTPLMKDIDLAASTILNMRAVNTPLTMKTDKGLYLSFHEAALYDYPGMTLGIRPQALKLYADLVPLSKKTTLRKAKIKTPFETPWRTIQIAETAGDLIDSYLILNLNEENKFKETDWIHPTKYMGIWWEMHIGKANWAKSAGNHGATTENAKRYIDFASRNGIPSLLIEGWNTGWESWVGVPEREGIFDFVTPYDDYNLEEVLRYGKEKGVNIVMHNETSAATQTYEKQLNTAFGMYQKNGIDAIKSGYVGPISPDSWYHHGQQMVKHYQRVLERAAQFKIMMNVHEPIKATGIRRTWPNMMTREGARGQEFNAWGKVNNGPNHTVTLPFTRGLGGPMDFTPGIFDLKFEEYKDKEFVPTTLAKQLALYVLIYSPFQMAADLPENYEGNLAFQFIRDVAVDWDKSIVIDGEIGEHLTMVRKERGQNKWFLGSATNEEARVIKVPLTFLNTNQQYVAHIYADGKNAHYETNPSDILVDKYIVDSKTEMVLQLSEGGGQAIMFRPASRTADRNIKTY